MGLITTAAVSTAPSLDNGFIDAEDRLVICTNSRLFVVKHEVLRKISLSFVLYARRTQQSRIYVKLAITDQRSIVTSFQEILNCWRQRLTLVSTKHASHDHYMY